MIKFRFNIIYFLLICFLLISAGFSQSNRSIINEGVDKYEEKKYTDAEVDFRKAVENSPKNFEANFNLGNAYYKQEKYEEALRSYAGSLESARDDQSRAKVLHNMGNTLLKSDKIEQSIDAYKNALKFNPDDADTKYNLSYALELLKNKDKNQQNKQDEQQQNEQQNQDQNKDQQNKDQNEKQNQNPQDQEAKQDNTRQSQLPEEEKISREEAQRILDALKNNEKDLQKQLRKKTGRVKKTDKDW